MKKFFYRVCEGDSVFSLSEKFGISVCEIIKQNNLQSEICAGDLLYLEKVRDRPYKVNLSDTLGSLAKRFNLSEQEILEQNGISYIFYGLSIKI